MKDRVFSGMQPTGNMTLGNYLGAIKHWVNLQEQFESFFCLVDLHAITMPISPKVLHQNIIENYAMYLACGLDHKRSTIFKQSASFYHTELAWILACCTQLGWLNRMTQFKDKAGKDKQKSNLGLYAYPTLQAADVLLYHANKVPVGDDQIQHLELAREIARAFNRKYDVEFFDEPEAIVATTGARIMSLRDGSSKMSKSDPSDMSRINLIDDIDLIASKFKKAKSDSLEYISYDVEKRPEISNLLSIYAICRDISIEDAVLEFEGKNNSALKAAASDAVIEVLSPIQRRYNDFMNDKSQLLSMLDEGGERATEIASQNIKQVFDIVGF